MSLAPLLDAPLAIQLHAFAAMAAFALGAVQLAGIKGTAWHRGRGFVWVGLMLIVAISSFWIHEIRLWGPWSPIHLLSILTLGVAALAPSTTPTRIRCAGIATPCWACSWAPW